MRKMNLYLQVVCALVLYIGSLFGAYFTIETFSADGGNAGAAMALVALIHVVAVVWCSWLAAEFQIIQSILNQGTHS